MSAHGDRVQIFPSRGNLMIMKLKLASSKQGHELLQTKVDALELRFRKALKNLIAAREYMGRSSSDCFFKIAQANFHVRPIALHQTVLGGVAEAQLTSRAVNENVAGVRLPRFVLLDSEKDAYDGLMMARGGERVRELKEAWREMINQLVELASLQTTFQQLDEVIRTTKRRVHALENVLIPRYENTVNYIIGELDELEREDFYRIKMLQKKKKQAKDKSNKDKPKKIGAGDFKDTVTRVRLVLRKCERWMLETGRILPCAMGAHGSPSQAPAPTAPPSTAPEPSPGPSQGPSQGPDGEAPPAIGDARKCERWMLDTGRILPCAMGAHGSPSQAPAPTASPSTAPEPSPGPSQGPSQGPDGEAPPAIGDAPQQNPEDAPQESKQKPEDAPQESKQKPEES